MSILTLLRMSPWLAILLLLGIVAAQSNTIHKWHTQADHCATAREVDRQSYVNAQAQAKALNTAQVERVKAEQEKLNNAKVSKLSDRLELIRGELRKPQAPAPASPSGSTPTSPGVEGPCRVIDPTWLCLSPAERLHAAENEERHDELIDLVIEQSQVNPN